MATIELYYKLIHLNPSCQEWYTVCAYVAFNDPIIWYTVLTNTFGQKYADDILNICVNFYLTRKNSITLKEIDELYRDLGIEFIQHTYT